MTLYNISSITSFKTYRNHRASGLVQCQLCNVLHNWHTHASLLLKAGESLKLISERLGHAGLGITSDIYTHLMPGMQKKAAAKFQELIFFGDIAHQTGTKDIKKPPE